MCQLCEIKNIAARDRWPNTLEQHKPDINFLVTSAHDEYTTARSKSSIKPNDPAAPLPQLLEYLRLLSTLLDQIESDRELWWTSPPKREQRRQLELECEQRKLSELHKIHNRVVEGIEGMRARLGVFVRWGLGVEGGMEGLAGLDGEGEGRKGGKAVEAE